MTAVMLFVTVFSMSVFANAATTFTPRTSAPSPTNKYFYSDINVFYKYGYGMPNCTAYAYGRAYEILKSEPKLSHNDAGVWFDYNKKNKYYSYGNTPKLGAIACWSYSGGGHVAVVEKIENGKVTFSNSEWGGRTFYTTASSVSDPNFGGNNWWTFNGFIYILDDEPNTAYSTGVYKTNVTTTLNMRSGAGTSYDYVASIPNGVKLTVTKVKPNGGYTWGYTTYKGKKGWVALDYCIYVSPLPTTAPQTTAKPTTNPTTKPATVPTTEVVPTTTVPTTTKPSVPETTVQKGLGVGDVNYDNSINIRDVTEIQRYIVDVKYFTEEQIKFADFDFSGYVDVNDITCMQKYLSKQQ